MSDHDALLMAICATPDDDLTRLVYADWLDEHGEPERGEFIRVQCELADPVAGKHCGNPAEQDTPCSECIRFGELRRRERELLEWGGYGWCDGLLGPEWKTGGVGKADADVTVSYHHGAEYTGHMRIAFRRGFPDALTLSAADWLAHHELLWWSPGQTVELYRDESYSTINVPRPFVPTAQPITKVTLTNTNPEILATMHPVTITEPDPRHFSSRWPGLVFRLPEPAHATA